MFYDRLKELCFEKGVKLTNLTEELNMSRGNMSRWKNGGIPKGDTLKLFADYFGVSVDYLLGNSNQRTPSGYPVNAFALQLDQFMKNNYLSDEKVCELCEISPSVLDKWRKTGKAQYRSLKKLMEYYGLPEDYFGNDFEDRLVVDTKKLEKALTLPPEFLDYFNGCDNKGRMRIIQCAMNEYDRTQTERKTPKTGVTA